MENIAEKVVAITGASSGLGAETARHLVRAGAKVALGARRKDRLDALVDELGADNAMAFRVDVTKREELQGFVDAARDRFGRIDAMLHNAGLMPFAPLAENRHDEWDQCIDVNLKGVLYGLGAVLPVMQAQGAGQNIFVSSVAGHVCTPIGAVYSATKFGVRAIAESLRQEVKAWGGRVTVLSPGAVATELPQSIRNEEIAKAMADYYAEAAIPADAFARGVVYAVSQPEDVDINEILMRPTSQQM
ncbi:SDR family oxidoreductase [Mangrovicoccus ximenensis]|uniref:SDR family oxidoreductase n=1 Tax=Mangrovicoccus ximenensis TaxID=1911570 RepID=UPI000D3C2037|nr:SDR family oxidoreductase [Mangrovicoccus ximenensis]